jgi:lipopolysaccharide/colanic/teichoic acid biosynthesis glycosyltransferase
MYKFRSMRQDAEELKAKLEAQNEASGLMFKMHDDPRVTRVGRVIRRLSLDELPQLFNVVNGSMSIVGPRPPLPIEVALYESRHLERLKGIPGITGLWQIRRGDTIDFEEMVALDIEYLDNWSLLSDIAIILKTVPAMLKGRGAS